MSNSTFRDTIEALLEGRLICEVSEPLLCQYLNGDESLEKVNLYLSKIDREVSKTLDMNGFYCVYSNIEGGEVKRKIIRQFENLSTRWEALLLWLRFTRQVSENSHPLGYKEILKESELLAAIENSSSLQLELDDITNRFQTKGRAGGSRTRLSGLLEYLCSDGFLVEISPSTYLGTARWSMLQDQMEFIREQDGIESDSPEVDDAQGVLF